MGLGSCDRLRRGSSVLPCKICNVGRCCGTVGIGAKSCAGGEETLGLRWYRDILR